MLYLTNNGDLSLYKVGQGVIATHAAGVTPSNFVDIRIVTSGPAIHVYLNGSGQQVLSVEDSSYSSGYVSLVTGRTHSVFDQVGALGAYHDLFASASKWSADSGTWAIEANEYSQSATDSFGHSSTLQTRTVHDNAVSVWVKVVNNGGNSNHWAGVQFRKQQLADKYYESGYLVYIRDNGILELFKAGEGVLDEYDTGITPDSFVKIQVVMNGAYIHVCFNGSARPVISVIDSEYASGSISVVTGKTHAHFDTIDIR